MAKRGRRRKKPGPKPGRKKSFGVTVDPSSTDRPIKVRVWKPGKTDELLADHLLAKSRRLFAEATRYETAAHTLKREISVAKKGRR